MTMAPVHTPFVQGLRGSTAAALECRYITLLLEQSFHMAPVWALSISGHFLTNPSSQHRFYATQQQVTCVLRVFHANGGRTYFTLMEGEPMTMTEILNNKPYYCLQESWRYLFQFFLKKSPKNLTYTLQCT